MVVNYIHSSFSYPCPNFCEWNSDPPSGWNQNISPGIPPLQSLVPPLSHYQASANLLRSTPKTFWLLLTAYLSCFPGSAPSGGPKWSQNPWFLAVGSPFQTFFFQLLDACSAVSYAPSCLSLWMLPPTHVVLTQMY